MKNYTDQALVHMRMLVQSLGQENKRQLDKWGVQSRPLPEWMLWLTEEVGELANAIGEMVYRGGTYENVYNEAVQVATLALKIAETVEIEREVR